MKGTRSTRPHLRPRQFGCREVSPSLVEHLVSQWRRLQPFRGQGALIGASDCGPRRCPCQALASGPDQWPHRGCLRRLFRGPGLPGRGPCATFSACSRYRNWSLGHVLEPGQIVASAVMSCSRSASLTSSTAALITACWTGSVRSTMRRASSLGGPGSSADRWDVGAVPRGRVVRGCRAERSCWHSSRSAVRR